MLVLSRKRNEEIWIGNNIKVSIASVNGGKVKVGIEAPPEIHIRRGELPFCGDFPEDDGGM